MNTTAHSEKVLLSGDEAVARGAWEAGVKVAAAYPGTPATEILESLAKFADVDAQWSVNEKVAYEVTYGAAIGGARALTACKHVGLNVAMDPLMTSAYTGINAGFVVVVADDPGLHSSQNEQDTRWVGLYGKLPILEPSDPAEALEFTKIAFEISEQFDTPVLLRLTTRVAHSKQDVAVGTRTAGPHKAFHVDATKYVMVPRNAGPRHAVVEARLARLREYAEQTPLNRTELRDRQLGFVTSGVSYLYVREMFPAASVLKLGFSYPFCDETIRAFAAQVQGLVVIEELDPFIETHLLALGLKLLAKHPSFRVGELRPEFIPAIVRGEEKQAKPFPARKPVLCPGCAHRAVFTVLRDLKLVVAGDIGCYTLGAAPPLASVHTCLCMGSGITIHEGFRRARIHNNRIVGVVGDSTFVHSGITGLINAVYNRVKGVLLILDNGTTAMTGAQHHPATGKTIREEPTRKLVLEDLCRACGADHVDVVDAMDTGLFRRTLEQRLEDDALSVIIARSPCWQLVRTRNAPPEFQREQCQQCYECLEIDCPALSKTEDGMIQIDPARCTGCNLCVDRCAYEALLPVREAPDEGNCPGTSG
jgi:indolepyruvate ferredoxin oxidoreductase alpha subunit